jgi:hypothetical protein
MNAHAKMPQLRDGSWFVYLQSIGIYSGVVWWGIAVHGKTYVLGHLLNDVPCWVSNPSSPLKA